MASDPTPIPADPCFTIETVSGHVVVTFTSDALVNPAELERIGHKLYALADENLRDFGTKVRLVLDFQKIRNFNSQAVGILLTLNRKLGRGPAFSICCVGPALMQLLRLTRLDQVLTITATRDEALKLG